MSNDLSGEANVSVTISHDGSPLRGEVDLPGGKHAFAHVVASAAMCDKGQIENVPENADTLALIDALKLIFNVVEHVREARQLSFAEPLPRGAVQFSSELAARSRNLFCLMPAVLHHRGELRISSTPAGCEIGARPTDWYVRTMQQFGAVVHEVGASIRLTWRHRRPAQILFAYPSMTGTVIALAAAAGVPGTSEIVGGTAEPSCREQGEAMSANGRPVNFGERLVVMNGQPRDFHWRLGPDRIHAATILTAGLLTRGSVSVRFDQPLRMPQFVKFCRQIGADVYEDRSVLRVSHPDGRPLRAVNLTAGSEPLFSSDWAPFAALLMACRAEGTSTIVDEAFVDRFQFFYRLKPAGLKNFSITRAMRGGREVAIATIKGNPDTRLRGTSFDDTPDIRGSAAVLLTALIADGPCSIPRDTHLRRGYEDFPAQLKQIGLTPTEARDAS